MADPVIATGNTAPANANFGQRLEHGLFGLVSVRRADGTTGNDLTSRVNLITADLVHDDVAGAYAVWQALPANAKTQSESWGCAGQDQRRGGQRCSRSPAFGDRRALARRSRDVAYAPSALARFLDDPSSPLLRASRADRLGRRLPRRTPRSHLAGLVWLSGRNIGRRSWSSPSPLLLSWPGSSSASSWDCRASLPTRRAAGGAKRATRPCPRGLVAVHAGDARTAGRASVQATKQLKNDPLALMLKAQSAPTHGRRSRRHPSLPGIGAARGHACSRFARAARGGEPARR